MTLQETIIAQLGVKPSIDPKEEIRKSVDFLKAYMLMHKCPSKCKSRYTFAKQQYKNCLSIFYVAMYLTKFAIACLVKI